MTAGERGGVDGIERESRDFVDEFDDEDDDDVEDEEHSLRNNDDFKSGCSRKLLLQRRFVSLLVVCDSSSVNCRLPGDRNKEFV